MVIEGKICCGRGKINPYETPSSENLVISSVFGIFNRLPTFSPRCSRYSRSQPDSKKKARIALLHSYIGAMVSTLQTLPSELLEKIGTHCNRHSQWSTLRLICRELQVETRRAWTKRFFRCRRAFLEYEKLSELIEIRKVPDLASAVTDINVHCDNDT